MSIKLAFPSNSNTVYYYQMVNKFCCREKDHFHFNLLVAIKSKFYVSVGGDNNEHRSFEKINVL